MSGENNPFLTEKEQKSPQFNYSEASEEQLRTHLNTTLTAKALRTYEYLMNHSKDEKIRKASADAIMEHSKASSKNNLPEATGGTQINVQFNEYITKTTKSLLDVASATKQKFKEVRDDESV